MHEVETDVSKSVIVDNTDGEKELAHLIGRGNFSNPKPTTLIKRFIQQSSKNNDMVVDFFAGSGTTGQAVMDLNETFDENRKFLLVEMGEYFESVVKKRILKLMYSTQWKDQIPQEMNTMSMMISYFALEQYEDSLNNIEFDESRPTFSFQDQIKYTLRYGTKGSPTLAMTDKFDKPFDYVLEIVEKNERKPQKIDLVSTFNYLLGLWVERIITEEHQGRIYRIITGSVKGQKHTIIWRNTDNLNYDNERAFVLEREWYDENAVKYANIDNTFGAKPIEEAFKRLMFEGTSHDAT